MAHTLLCLLALVIGTVRSGSIGYNYAKSYAGPSLHFGAGHGLLSQSLPTTTISPEIALGAEHKAIAAGISSADSIGIANAASYGAPISSGAIGIASGSYGISHAAPITAGYAAAAPAAIGGEHLGLAHGLLASSAPASIGIDSASIHAASAAPIGLATSAPIAPIGLAAPSSIGFSGADHIGLANGYGYSSAIGFDGAGISSYDHGLGFIAEAPIVNTQFFIHTAPEDYSQVTKAKHIKVGHPQKNYRVVFIRTPSISSANAQVAVDVAPQEEKTVIYVLSQQQQDLNINGVVTGEPSAPSKPEVFFIKYKTPEEAIHAQQQIQAQYAALGGSSQVSDEGISPVTSVIGSLGQGTIATGAIAHGIAKIPAYAPSSIGIAPAISTIGHSAFGATTTFAPPIEHSTLGITTAAPAFASEAITAAPAIAAITSAPSLATAAITSAPALAHSAIASPAIDSTPTLAATAITPEGPLVAHGALAAAISTEPTLAHSALKGSLFTPGTYAASPAIAHGATASGQLLAHGAFSSGKSLSYGKFASSAALNYGAIKSVPAFAHGAIKSAFGHGAIAAAPALGFSTTIAPSLAHSGISIPSGISSIGHAGSIGAAFAAKASYLPRKA